MLLVKRGKVRGGALSEFNVHNQDAISARHNAERRPAVCRNEDVDSPILDERPAAQLAHRLPQLVLRVHHDRPVPRDWLLKRPA